MDPLASSSSHSVASTSALVRGTNPLMNRSTEPKNCNARHSIANKVLTKKPSGTSQDNTSEIVQVDPRTNKQAGGVKDYQKCGFYMPLCKAALEGDWEKASSFFIEHSGASNAMITPGQETALHLAVRAGRSIDFVTNLLPLMSKEALEYEDHTHYTALAVSAIVGNIEAARLLVVTHPPLLHIKGKLGNLPVHFAAKFGHREMLVYLYEATKATFDVESDFFTEHGPILLSYMILSGFVDIALEVVQSHLELVTTLWEYGHPMEFLAGRPELFLSGSNLNFCSRQIYEYLPTNLPTKVFNSPAKDIEDPPYSSRDIDTPPPCLRRQFFKFGSIVRHHFNSIDWLRIPKLVAARHVKCLQETKLMHESAIQLVKFMSQEIAKLDYPVAEILLRPAFMSAAKSGVHEVIEEILYSFPHAIWFSDRITKRCVFEEAIKERHENVFNLIYQTRGHNQDIAVSLDTDTNSILHLAGKLAPQHKRSRIPGAVLQMQRELQWFKEVEKFVNPNFKEYPNKDRKTPKAVFTEEHKDLRIEGENWMKSTASSCSFVAALIATVVFQAAITVPGSYSTDGYPNLSNKKTFTFFAISDSISFLSATISVFMFTSILTARYAEDDFLYALPKRLIIGLLSLLISIATMMMAFVSSIILVFGISKGLAAVVSILACLPISFFVLSQGRVLVSMIRSTYGRGIFGKQSDRILY